VKIEATHLCPRPRVKDHIGFGSQLDQALSIRLLYLNTNRAPRQPRAQVPNAFDRGIWDAPLSDAMGIGSAIDSLHIRPRPRSESV
jgi:hypothetical protein